MKIGFSGTRKGMTVKQYLRVSDWFRYDLGDAVVTEAHHGCCIGADAEFQLAIIRGRIGGTSERQWAEIHAHPCTLAGMVDRDAEALADVVHDPLPPLDRNRVIVDSCDLLIATPAEAEEQQRSGTWSTIRFAERQGKPIILVLPSGEVRRETP
jgi:hypothetical protein